MKRLETQLSRFAEERQFAFIILAYNLSLNLVQFPKIANL